MSKDMPTDADATQQQVEASISQVEADVRKMSTFEEDVRRNLLEQDKVKQGITHALGYFRRQEELAQDERDQTHVKVQRLEDEVASLQHRIKSLEADKATLTKDKVHSKPERSPPCRRSPFLAPSTLRNTFGLPPDLAGCARRGEQEGACAGEQHLRLRTGGTDRPRLQGSRHRAECHAHDEFVAKPAPCVSQCHAHSLLLGVCTSARALSGCQRLRPC